MSDSEHSSVTYTSVPSPVEDYSDIGSPEVDGPPSLDYVPGPKEPEQAPLSPDYVPGPEEPEQAPLSPDYVPGPEEPEQAPPSPVYLPYVPELGDLEEDDKEDPEEDPTDYPANSIVIALPAIDHVPSEEIPESCLPIQKWLRFASPTPSQEVGESSSAGAARQDELAVARDDPYSLSCLPIQKWLRFASPTPSQEVGESSSAGAARQDEPAVARDNPYSLVREELYGFVDR
nr:hypothetical protein [Tanacetum cinerariifolium]